LRLRRGQRRRRDERRRKQQRHGRKKRAHERRSASEVTRIGGPGAGRFHDTKQRPPVRTPACNRSHFFAFSITSITHLSRFALPLAPGVLSCATLARWLSVCEGLPRRRAGTSGVRARLACFLPDHSCLSCPPLLL
jgi:hypothetical protein